MSFILVKSWLVYLAAPLLGALIFIIVISTCWIHLLRIMSICISNYNLSFKIQSLWYENCYPSILLRCIGMKNGFPSLHIQSGCIFRFKWVSCRQQIDGKWLFIQFEALWHFMGAFRVLTLRVIIERYDFNDVMLPVKSLFL